MAFDSEYFTDNSSLTLYHFAYHLTHHNYKDPVMEPVEKRARIDLTTDMEVQKYYGGHDDPEADIVLESLDKMRFRVHSYHLKAAR